MVKKDGITLSSNFFGVDDVKVFLREAEYYAGRGDYKQSKELYKKFYYYIFKQERQDYCLGPISLYSFRTYNTYSVQDLINSEITVVHPSKMNDPFDSLITFLSKEENLKNICKVQSHVKIQSEIFKHFRIRSFATGRFNQFMKNDEVLGNTLMWSNYADSHRGFCIRYELSDDFTYKFAENSNTNDYSFSLLQLVRYHDEPVGIKSRLNTLTAFSLKKRCWEYENEVRLITYDTSTDKDHLGIKLDEGSRIAEIVFGYNCPDEVVETIRELFVGDSVSFSKMKINNDDVMSLVKEKIV